MSKKKPVEIRVWVDAEPPLDDAIHAALKHFYTIDNSEDFQKWQTTIYLRHVNQETEKGREGAVAAYVQACNGKKAMPLFMSDNFKAWDDDGYDIAQEFLWNLESNAALLPLRILHLSRMYPDGLDWNILCDFVAGRYRRKLGFDKAAHGISNEAAGAIVSLRRWASDHSSTQENIPANWKEANDHPEEPGKTEKCWPQHFCKSSAEPIFQILFPKTSDQINTIAKKMESLLKGPRINKEALIHSLDRLDSSLPRWVGHGLHCFLSVKPCVLVVDDEAESVVSHLENIPLRSESGKIPLGDVISFIPAFTGLRKKADDYLAELIEFLEEKNTYLLLRQFDAVLLDLSFAAKSHSENHTGDPLGWRMLPIIRRYLPDIPIIVHSSYGTATQIRRAYESGAGWFLKKDESHKLPSRLFQLLKPTQWRREWASLEKSALAITEFDLPAGAPLRGNDEMEINKYLWFRSLSDLPGGKIRIRPLGGGISGAVTVKACKELGASYDMLPPLIVKTDNPFDMGMEHERYRRFISPYLSNRAGRIDLPAVRAGHQRSAIRYTCAGASQGVSTAARSAEIVTLQDMMERNLPRSTREGGVLPATKYAELLDCLLNDMLPRIHGISPQWERHSDFPNPVFGEFSHPLNGYLARMPPSRLIELKKGLKTLDSTPVQNEQRDGVFMIMAPGGPSRLKALYMPPDEGSILERVDLTGPMVDFYIRFRYLRPYQVVQVDKADLKGLQSKLDFGLGWRELHIPDKCRLKLKEILKKTCKLEDIAKLLGKATEFSTHKAKTPLSRVRTGIIHGDLNMGNIMVERRRGGPPLPMSSEPWLIDFAWSRRDAIVVDYAQLEVDTLVRLGKQHVFENNTRLLFEFRDAYLETPWAAPDSVSKDDRRRFLWDILNQIRNAADRAGIDGTAMSHARLLALLILAKISINNLARGGREADCFPVALCLHWIQRQMELLSD